MPKVFRTFRKSIAKQLNAAAQEIILHLVGRANNWILRSAVEI
jgi:hypothetical protein